VTGLALNRLDRREGLVLVQAVAGNAALRDGAVILMGPNARHVDPLRSRRRTGSDSVPQALHRPNCASGYPDKASTINRANGGAPAAVPISVNRQGGSSTWIGRRSIIKVTPTADKRSQSSNAMLGSGPTTPQDYPERSGFGRRREREWGHGGTAAGLIRSPHLMRIYIIGNDGITLCRTAPSILNNGEIAVASNEELHTAPLSGKRLLALWNALPGVEKRKKVGDRDALIDQLWSAIELLPDPEPQPDLKGPSKQDVVIAMLRLPEGATVDEVASVTGWQRHTVRGVFSGTLKKKLGLTLASAKEERGRVYRIAEPASP
jgi:hypothetical protein